VLPGDIEVDIVRAGCRQADKTQPGHFCQRLAGKPGLVGKHTFDITQAPSKLLVACLAIHGQLIDCRAQALEVQPGTHGIEIQEYGFHGILVYSAILVAGKGARWPINSGNANPSPR
jgi:hypothetical protein